MEERYRKYIPHEDIYLFNTGKARKAWLCYGCVYIKEEDVFRFMVWAPNAKSVSVVGDFNGWNGETNPMEPVEGGVWCAFIGGLKEGMLYKYDVLRADGTRIMKSDPFAAYSQHGVNTASIVCRDCEYNWQDGEYMSRRGDRSFMESPMSIYELHLGSWCDLENGRSVCAQLIEKLVPYVAEMGYTHVEFMPIMEYPLDASWGYQVTGYYAPSSRYGTRDEMMALIDAFHHRGIGVIMDWVPAHFPKDDHGLRLFDGTPLYECKERRMAEHPEWGTLIFDYASPQVRSFLISSACKFIEIYHIDGIRVDAVTSMLYLNYGRRDGEFTPNREGGCINLDAVDFLRELNDAVLSSYPGTVTIAEESTAYPGITAPADCGGLGFCLKWDMGYMHDTLDYMSLDPIYRSGCHDKLTFSMMYAFSENFVLAYSHDEVVHGKRSMLNKMWGEYDEKFASLRALYGYTFAHPGRKLTFMGGEFGQFIEWDWQKGLDWLLLDYPRHAQMRGYCRELNRLYVAHPALFTDEKSWDGFRWLSVDDRDRSSIAFLRTSKDGGDMLICACNFTPVEYPEFGIALPEEGTLREIFSSDAECYGGGGRLNDKPIHSQPFGFMGMDYHAALRLPPLSCLWFEYKPLRKGKEHGNESRNKGKKSGK